jgi:hypothetical protein
LKPLPYPPLFRSEALAGVAHVALGELLTKLGRNDEAQAHLAAALQLALAELERSATSLPSPQHT